MDTMTNAMSVERALLRVRTVAPVAAAFQGRTVPAAGSYLTVSGTHATSALRAVKPISLDGIAGLTWRKRGTDDRLHPRTPLT